LIGELSRRLDGGAVLGEVPILTDIGVRVPDLAWISHRLMAVLGNASPLPRAPELCVEIVSRSNSDIEIREKTRAYLVAGAQELWIVSEEGTIRYFDAQGERVSSLFNVDILLPKPPDAG
jgi:Uma2 family endonuclease